MFKLHTMSNIGAVFVDAIATGESIMHDLEKGLYPGPKSATRFNKLKVILAALPPDDGYRLATAVACESTAEKGETMASRWQLSQLVRRLRYQRKTWDGDDDTSGSTVAATRNPRYPKPALATA